MSYIQEIVHWTSSHMTELHFFYRPYLQSELAILLNSLPTTVFYIIKYLCMFKVIVNRILVGKRVNHFQLHFYLTWSFIVVKHYPLLIIYIYIYIRTFYIFLIASIIQIEGVISKWVSACDLLINVHESRPLTAQLFKVLFTPLALTIWYLS